MHKHYYTSSTTQELFGYRPCAPWIFFSFFFSLLLSQICNQPCFVLHSYFSCPSVSQGPHFIFCEGFYALLPQNLLKNKVCTYLIQSSWQYGFASLLFITLVPLTPFTTQWLATHIFPCFSWPTSRQWHWSPHNRDINNPWFLVLTSGKM